MRGRILLFMLLQDKNETIGKIFSLQVFNP